MKGPLYRQRRLESLPQRFTRWLRRRRGQFEKRQRVYLVETAGLRMKRVVMPDAHMAAEIAAHLTSLGRTGVFPQLLARHANELWVEFIEGDHVTHTRAPVEELARVFAALYSYQSRADAAQSSAWAARIEQDVAFLGRAGVLDGARADELIARGHRSRPEAVWIGYDYGDARPQNFLSTDGGRLRAIDVESIRHDTLIGMGAARAYLRWPGVDRNELLANIRRHGAPPFADYADFVELAFLASWTKRCLLLGKTKLVEPQLFDRIVSAG